MIMANCYFWLHRHAPQNPVNGDNEEGWCEDTISRQMLSGDVGEILAQADTNACVLMKSDNEV